MKRVILVVLDSVGVGELPDAAKYGDVGSNTLGHTVKATGLRLPNMEKMGLGFIEQSFLPKHDQATGLTARMKEASPGKDTTTGHWEMAGVKLSQPFPTYPNGFPKEVIEKFEAAIGTKTLGNYPASGTAIIEELGEEHLRTGYPIVYTSADPVFQIAANEAIISNERLYEMCEIARAQLVGEHAVGRVIARPFVGNKKGSFRRTAARRDFSLEPQGETILDALKEAGHEVIGVGKIEDIFAHRGLTISDHAAGNKACTEAMLKHMDKAYSGLLFVNLVDFDMVYGHRRDVKNYAAALKDFDDALPDLMGKMTDDDILIITADHGCDPTFRGTDHTREYAPLLAWQKESRRHIHLDERDTFADIAATIAEFFGLPQRFDAQSFLDDLLELKQ
ncbi:MAG: phosphopentomutase [Christensenellales bacterium]|jgi:phosphopentomutase|nr:phosphopentomutase [Clostridiales bacterium]